jgi:hypothetical protein
VNGNDFLKKKNKKKKQGPKMPENEKQGPKMPENE